MSATESDRADALRRLAAGDAEAERSSSFEGADLAAISLPGGALRCVDLSGANLAGADLSDAMLGGAKLCRARLEEAVLQRADLIGADLSGAQAGEANFAAALLEDARLDGASLRFSNLTGAVLDGASLRDVDLWGADLSGVAAERACMRGAHLEEMQAAGANFAGSDLTGATLRRTDLSRANLRGATLRDTVLDGVKLGGADLSHAVLPFAVLTECELRHVRLAGAWLERTRMQSAQLGGAVGEEVTGDYAAAYSAYTALELNFRSLGSAEEESWAFRRRRRMGKRAHRAAALAAVRAGALTRALLPGGRYLVDGFSEWLCDYGESLARVLRAFASVMLVFAALYWLTGGLVPREDMPLSAHRGWLLRGVDYLLFSLDSMTTVGTGLVELRPAGELAVVMSSVQTVLGIVLLGLFGFVLGARMRR